MTVLREGALKLTLPHGVKARKFDDQKNHGLSHCMKAVDFIVEESNEIIFIEFKDLDHPHVDPQDREAFLEDQGCNKLIWSLVHKYRDSFIYLWAENATQKPIKYYVLIALSKLDEAMLLNITENLKRKLPVAGPPSGVWQRQIVIDCSVFNMETWNKNLQRYPITREDP